MSSCFFDRFGLSPGTLDPRWQRAPDHATQWNSKGRGRDPSHVYIAQPPFHPRKQEYLFRLMNCRNSRQHVYTFTPWLCKGLSKRPRSKVDQFFVSRKRASASWIIHPSLNACPIVSSLNSSSLWLSREPLGLGCGGDERLPLCVVSPMGKKDRLRGKPGLSAARLWNRWLARYEIARH